MHSGAAQHCSLHFCCPGQFQLKGLCIFLSFPSLSHIALQEPPVPRPIEAQGLRGCDPLLSHSSSLLHRRPAMLQDASRYHVISYKLSFAVLLAAWIPSFQVLPAGHLPSEASWLVCGRAARGRAAQSCFLQRAHEPAGSLLLFFFLNWLGVWMCGCACACLPHQQHPWYSAE